MDLEALVPRIKEVRSLRRFIRKEIARQYPELARPSFWQSNKRKARAVLQSPITWAVVFFAAFVLINNWMLNREWILRYYNLNSADGTGDVLSSFIDTAAATLGIVIPLIILLIEFVGRDSSRIIDIYFKETRVSEVVISALVIIAIYGITKFAVQAQLIESSVSRFHLLLFMLFLIVGLLITVGLLLNRVRKSLNRDYFIRAYLDELTEQVRQSQRQEAEYRYTRVAQVELAKDLGFDKPMLSVVPGTAESAVPLSVERSGRIQDINPVGWVELSKRTQFHKRRDKDSIKGYLVKLVGDFVEKSDSVAYVFPHPEPHRKIWNPFEIRLPTLFRQSITIAEATESSLDEDVTRLLEHLKTLTQNAIHEQNDILFDQLLEVYRKLLQRGIELPDPPKDSPFEDMMFPEWKVLSTITFHLRDVIEVAAQTPTDRFIRHLAYLFETAVREVIIHCDMHVSQSLKRLLQLFVDIYRFSAQHGNSTGLAKAYQPLLQVVDISWGSQFEKHHQEEIILK